MIISELIEHLLKFDQNLTVVSTHQSIFEIIEEPILITIKNDGKIITDFPDKIRETGKFLEMDSFLYDEKLVYIGPPKAEFQNKKF